MVYKDKRVLQYIADNPNIFMGRNNGEAHLFWHHIILCGKVAQRRIYKYKSELLKIHGYIEICCLDCLINLAIMLKSKIEGNKVGI